MNQVSWKSTLFAGITVVAGFVLFSPQWFPPVVIDVAKYVTLGGLAAWGYTTKDFDVSGGQRGLTGKTGPLGPAGIDAPQMETTEKITERITTVAPPPATVSISETVQPESRP